MFNLQGVCSATIRGHALIIRIQHVLNLPDVKERVDLYKEHEEKFNEQILDCATEFDNLVVLDLRGQEDIWAGNRFVIYALFPQCNISIHAMWGFKKQNTVFATGKSIFNKSSKTNVGELMLSMGGGGHSAAGTCQIENDDANDVLEQLVEKITQDG